MSDAALDSAPLRSAGRSLADQAYEVIRVRLVTLEIPPGSPINDESLATELGVGRTPVREALKRLEQDRLVVTYARRGTFATRVEITDLAYLSEIRAELEPLAARRAARYASPAAADALRVAISDLDGLDDDVDVVTLLQRDAAVHRAIYQAAANPFLEDSLIRFNNLATRIWVLVMDRLDQVAGHLHSHSDLVAAILAGDADTAAALARAHVERFEQSVRAAL
jgi:DNA-binding GntR family transcriptional regulator